MSTGRASRTCLLNSGLPERGAWCESTAFRHSCARSSKRAGGLIPRIALDQCRVPERYRTRVPFRAPRFFVPIAQSTERARPKRQVVGENPTGDTSFCGCGSTVECGRDNGAIPFTRSISVGSVAHQQSARLTCERKRGQHSPLPPFFEEGIAQSAERVLHMHQVEARFLLPSPFLSLWCSSANTPASHAGDHRSEAGQGRQFNRPQSIVSDAIAR
jgi:hypothetical protein